MPSSSQRAKPRNCVQVTSISANAGSTTRVYFSVSLHHGCRAQGLSKSTSTVALSTSTTVLVNDGNSAAWSDAISAAVKSSSALTTTCQTSSTRNKERIQCPLCA
jgi:hypothetical protein